MRCGRAQQLMTTAADGELAERRRRALDAHLGRCPTCQRELAATARLLAALDGLPGEAEVPASVEQTTFRRVRLAAAEEEELGSRPRWRWLPIPAFAVATAAVALLAVGLFRSTPGGPGAPAVVRPQAADRVAEAEPADRAVRTARRAASVPPSEPPPELAAAPDLFMDLPMLKNLEKIEHFDAIRTTTLGDAPDPPDGSEGPSNG